MNKSDKVRAADGWFARRTLCANGMLIDAADAHTKVFRPATDCERLLLKDRENNPSRVFVMGGNDKLPRACK